MRDAFLDRQTPYRDHAQRPRTRTRREELGDAEVVEVDAVGNDDDVASAVHARDVGQIRREREYDVRRGVSARCDPAIESSQAGVVGAPRPREDVAMDEESEGNAEASRTNMRGAVRMGEDEVDGR